MKIRWKLLILLLSIALTPLIVGGVLHRLSTRRLGGRLASGTRQALTRAARVRLKRIVDDYGRMLDRDRKGLELALRVQASQVERRLADEASARAKSYFAEDYDQGNVPEGTKPSDKHFRAGADGKLAPVPVSYDEQVCFVVAGVDRAAIAGDIARLSTMPEVYRLVHDVRPNVFYWQYTSLESGLHTCYPGHGGYPADYDPRERLWYKLARDTGELVWLPPLTEVSTGSIQLGLTMPVRRPDGSFAGATAIDVPLSGVLEGIRLPREWANGAWTMFVVAGQTGTERQGRICILADRAYQGDRRNWRQHPEWKFLTSQAAAEFESLKTDALAGKSGVRRMPHEGTDAFWAYGAGGEARPFPIVIVPYKLVVAQADQAEQHVLRTTVKGLQITGLIMLAVVVVVVVIAFVSCRAVTRPVRELARCAEKLADGNYEAKVNIRTGDELQELGDAFNAMGPQLRERERMKRSLALAMEVQQHLLPQEAPSLPGFDIAGTSAYCDETGGDYFDFIDLVDLGDGKLGVAVGDVTGHGIGAALLMASARGVLRSHAGRHEGDLGRLFAALNRHLVRDTGEERFMTLFYGILDAADGSLRWTSGGHDPAFWLRRSSGRFKELPNTGIPLGVLEEADYAQGGPIHLESGDIIAVGTDGIWEANNVAGEMFGKERLREVLSACADRSAEDIHVAVVSAVNDFLGAGPQEDDITLVVIKAL